MANIDLKQGGATAGLGMAATATPGIVSVRVTGAQALPLLLPTSSM